MDIQSIQSIEGLDDFVVFLEIIEGYFIENGLKLSYKIENVYKLINSFYKMIKIKDYKLTEYLTYRNIYAKIYLHIDLETNLEAFSYFIIIIFFIYSIKTNDPLVINWGDFYSSKLFDTNINNTEICNLFIFIIYTFFEHYILTSHNYTYNILASIINFIEYFIETLFSDGQRKKKEFKIIFLFIVFSISIFENYISFININNYELLIDYFLYNNYFFIKTKANFEINMRNIKEFTVLYTTINNNNYSILYNLTKCSIKDFITNIYPYFDTPNVKNIKRIIDNIDIYLKVSNIRLCFIIGVYRGLCMRIKYKTKYYFGYIYLLLNKYINI